MKHYLVAAGVLALASCDMMPMQQASAPVEPGRQAQFVALVEQSDCRFDPVSHEPLHAAGFTDPEMSAIGRQLVAEGRAEIADDGDLVLTTGNCV